MARYRSTAILAILALFPCLSQAGEDKTTVLKLQGKLSDTDPRDQQRNGPSQTHAVKMLAGQVYTIDMVSSELDAYLRLMDPGGNQLDEDDDSGGQLNARIIFNCTKNGEYKVVCTTFAANMKGNYLLTIQRSVGNQKPGTAHALLIGKAAPDFKADFALNGPPLKLADLKGKVVLLHFWEVRSRASIALLPVLNGWHRAHKAEGLALVGVTFYPSDIGQKLGLDKATGKLLGVKTADRQTDQALLASVAQQHKLDHPLLALTKEESLAAFDAYAVNSLPQLVLIDRKGIIRMIDLGGTRSAADLESEFKKLLAEK